MADGSRMKRRILHTADLHLASLDDRACQSLAMLVNLAIKTNVDLIVIAGDLFDHNRVDDNLVSFVLEQLQRLAVTTVILPGNHDCLVPGCVFERGQLWKNCTNVRVLRASCGETLDLPGLGVSVWGKPIDSYEGNIRPLAGIPQPQSNGQWHIAVAHGYCVGNEPPVFPSFHIAQEEIVTSGWDYIALGHFPVFRCVCNESVKAYYCGSPSSLSGTVAIVDLDEETGVQVSCCSL